MVFRKEGFVEFVVSKNQIRICSQKGINTSHLYHVYLGCILLILSTPPWVLCALGTRDILDTPQIDVIQIEHICVV